MRLTQAANTGAARLFRWQGLLLLHRVPSPSSGRRGGRPPLANVRFANSLRNFPSLPADLLGEGATFSHGSGRWCTFTIFPGRRAAGRRRFPVTHYDHREIQENGIITVMTGVGCHRNTPIGNCPCAQWLDNNRMFTKVFVYIFSQYICSWKLKYVEE